ncbi:HD-GYP domain-containing protein [Lutispora sp.]|uniref:HD-GYP domain-containing protein n=1 Tax=Lutispora sp. TaxID=2828727 RepID=UPI00356AE7DA
MPYTRSERRIVHDYNATVVLELNEEAELVCNFLKDLFEYNQETAFHCTRVCKLSIAVGKLFNISELEMKRLCMASILHDIGKIEVPKSILNKPSLLTNHEYETIKKHSHSGYMMIKKFDYLKESAELILYHHERYDGNGYPYGICGKDIPFISRIISVADAYDAMISKRPYRSALSVNEALQILHKEKGKQFDGEVVDGFIEALDSKISKLDDRGISEKKIMFYVK